MKEKICKYLSSIVTEMSEAELQSTLEIPLEDTMGDLAFPCFVLAKNFHVDHLRTTIIGNALYKIYKKLGYNVVRINYLGDWGTQFGKLIVAYKLWSKMIRRL